MQSQKITQWFRKNLFALITIPLSISVLVYFLVKDNGRVGIRSFSRLQPVWLFWIAAGVAAGWLLEGLVLHLLCRHLYRGWSFGKSFYVGMVGLFYSALTPFCMGEPMEIYSMSKMGMETGAAGSIIAVKSLLHHGVTFFYSLVLVACELEYFQTKVSNFSVITVFALVTNSIFIFMVVLFLINPAVTRFILRGLAGLLNRVGLRRLSRKLYRKIREQLLIFHDSSNRMGKSWLLYAAAVVLTLVQITLASLISYFVYRSFRLRGEPAFTMIAADTFVTMAASFIPSPGSSGGAEGGFYLFFREFFGEHIVPGITLWRFSTYYMNILFGCLVLNVGRRKYKL